MNEQARRKMDEDVAQVQRLLSVLEAQPDNHASLAARELVQRVLELHASGLDQMLAIVREAANQPADTLLCKFTANPVTRALLLLHDLHPDDLPTRARRAVAKLRPRLQTSGISLAEPVVEDGRVRIGVAAEGQHAHRPDADELRRVIERGLLEMIPDAQAIELDGIETAAFASEIYVPAASIARMPAGTE